MKKEASTSPIQQADPDANPNSQSVQSYISEEHLSPAATVLPVDAAVFHSVLEARYPGSGECVQSEALAES